jgi:uncharacterized protein YndB with AHSA1/START domain
LTGTKIERSTDHATFVVERTLPAPVSRVFAAWADVALKRRWSSCHPDWRSEEHRLDFRIGGTEVSRVVEPGGTVHTMQARFLDIVPQQRIVYAYEMLLDDVRISVSLVTVVFEGGRSRTRMTFTEQVVFLDGHGDVAERIEGTEVGLDRIQAVLPPGDPGPLPPPAQA